MTKTTLIMSLFVLASGAYPATISNFSISTSAPATGGDPCSMSGSGPAFASCSSSTRDQFGSSAVASVNLTDSSIEIQVSSFADSRAQAFASITHDDFYSVPVNGPVEAVLSLTCANGLGPIGTIGHFSLGSTNVSPPVETIYRGAFQGSGPCDTPLEISRPPADYVVSLVATNNIVHLHTYIDASGENSDDSGTLQVNLTVNGFQDANGNPITATLLPEPGTLGTFGLALLVGVGMRGRRKLFGLVKTFLS